MCNEAIHTDPYSLAFVPDCFKTQKMCDKAINIDPFTQSHDHDNLKMWEMCIRAVEAGLGLLGHIPDWFVTQQQIDVWYDGKYWYTDDELIQWYKGYQKRKAQKAKIKEELLPIAWHPDPVMDWCMPEDEKRLRK